MPNYVCNASELDPPENDKATETRAIRVVISGDDWEKSDEPEWVIWPLDEDLDEATS